MSVTSPALPCDIPRPPDLPLKHQGWTEPLRIPGELRGCRDRDTALPAGPQPREAGTAPAVTWKGSGVTGINFPGPRKDRRGRDGAGRRQVPGLAGAGWVWVIWGGFGWVWERRGAARAGIPHPGRLPKGHKATSPPFLVPRGGKFGAVVEGIQDSGRRCRVWVSWPCSGASTGFKAQLPY